MQVPITDPEPHNRRPPDSKSARRMRIRQEKNGGNKTGSEIYADPKHIEPGVGNVAHGVLEGPDDGVQHQLELLGRDGEEGGETVQVNRLKYKAHFRIGT